MDSVDPADAQPAAGVEDELSRLGRNESWGWGKGRKFRGFRGTKWTFESKKEFVCNWTFSVSTARRQTPLKTIKHHRPCAPEKHLTPHAFYTTKYCREKSDLSFSFLDFSDLSLSDDYFFFCQTLFSFLFTFKSLNSFSFLYFSFPLRWF